MPPQKGLQTRFLVLFAFSVHLVLQPEARDNCGGVLVLECQTRRAPADEKPSHPFLKPLPRRPLSDGDGPQRRGLCCTRLWWMPVGLGRNDDRGVDDSFLRTHLLLRFAALTSKHPLLSLVHLLCVRFRLSLIAPIAG